MGRSITGEAGMSIRFFHKVILEELEGVFLSIEESHHARKVLRLDEYQSVKIFDGAGTEAEGILRYHGSNGCRVEIQSFRKVPRSAPSIVLAMAVPDHRDTLNDVIRESVQLGVARIILLKSRYCGLKRSGNPEKLIDKGRRIIINSCKQSGQLWMPELSGPVNFDTFLNDTGKEYDIFCGMAPVNSENAVKLVDLEVKSDCFAWMVGPEGGWSAEEIEFLAKHEIHQIRMGNLTLTTRVAAIIGLAALLTKFKHW